MTCAAKLLAYCVTGVPAPDIPATGVRGAPVRKMDLESLECIYSPLIPPQEFERDDALQFHSVLKSAFEKQAIIPFRFPTLLQNEAELKAHLRDKQAIYLQDLQRLAGLVQMELRFTADEQKSAHPRSGTEYMKAKQDASRALQGRWQEARSVLRDLVVDWKERPAELGLRCYALVKRPDVAVFRQRLESAKLSSGKPVLVSGPWPATEFLHD